jgi:hypothetical protein
MSLLALLVAHSIMYSRARDLVYKVVSVRYR